MLLADKELIIHQSNARGLTCATFTNGGLRQGSLGSGCGGGEVRVGVGVRSRGVRSGCFLTGAPCSSVALRRWQR
jgi:hypothetical protein